MLHFFAYRSLAKNANFREKKQMQKYDKIQILMLSSYSKEFLKFFVAATTLVVFVEFLSQWCFAKKFAKYDQKSFVFFRKSFCVLETLVMIGHPNNIFKVVSNKKPWEILFLKTRRRRLCLSFYVSGIFLFHLAGWMDG